MSNPRFQELFRAIDEIREKLKVYVGGDRGKEMLSHALIEKLKQLEVFSTDASKNTRSRQDIEEVIESSKLLIKLSYEDQTAHKDANRYHRLAFAYQELCLEDKVATLETLHNRALAFENISKARELEPGNPVHQQRYESMKKNYMTTLRRLIDEEQEQANANITANRNEDGIKHYKNAIFYWELVERLEGPTAYIFHSLAFFHAQIVLCSPAPSNRNENNALYALMVKSFNYIDAALQMQPYHDNFLNYKKTIAGKFIGFVRIRARILERENVDAAIETNQFLLRLFETLQSREEAEIAHVHHALATLYLTKTNEANLHDKHRYAKLAYEHVAKAHGLDPANLHHKLQLILLSETYAKSLRTQNPVLALSLYQESIRLNEREGYAPLDPKTLAFCYAGLAELSLNEEKQQQTALEHYLRAIEIKKAANLLTPEDNCMHMAINCYLLIGAQYEDALKADHTKDYLSFEILTCYRHALRLAEENQEPRKQGVAYKRLGGWYAFWYREYDKAAMFSREAAKLLTSSAIKAGVFPALDDDLENHSELGEELYQHKLWQEAHQSFAYTSNRIIDEGKAHRARMRR